MSTLREAAEQALEALVWESEGRLSEVVPKTTADAIDALRAALAAPQTTHSEDCYQWHHGCAVAEVKRLRAALQPERRKASTCVYPQCVSTTRTQCEAWALGACEERQG